MSLTPLKPFWHFLSFNFFSLAVKQLWQSFDLPNDISLPHNISDNNIQDAGTKELAQALK